MKKKPKPKPRTKPKNPGAQKPAKLREEPQLQKKEKLTSFHTKFAIDPEDGMARSMFDMVDEHLQVDSRGKVVRDLCPVFGVKPRTIDGVIAQVKEVWAEEMKKTRAERVDKSIKRLDSVYRRAKKKGDLAMEKAAVEAQAKFTGDNAPEVHILAGNGQGFEAAQAEAERLRKLLSETKD